MTSRQGRPPKFETQCPRCRGNGWVNQDPPLQRSRKPCEACGATGTVRTSPSESATLLEAWRRWDRRDQYFTATNLGSALWGQKSNNKPQSYAPPAGVMLKRLNAKGLVWGYFDHYRHCWQLTPAGRQVAMALDGMKPKQSMDKSKR